MLLYGTHRSLPLGRGLQAFDDCTTINMTFKLLDSFEGLLDREVIAADLEKKNTDLLNSYWNDLKDVSELFNTYKDKPVVAKNSAPYSGAVAWVRGLVERIEEPMIKLSAHGSRVMETDRGREVQKVYDALMTAMNEYQGQRFATWCEQVRAKGDELGAASGGARPGRQILSHSRPLSVAAKVAASPASLASLCLCEEPRVLLPPPLWAPS